MEAPSKLYQVSPEEAMPGGPIEAKDFALLRVVNESTRTPVFWLMGKMHRNACQCWIFVHLVVILTLVDLITFPFRFLCGHKPGQDRLLLRYQLQPGCGEDLITDLVLGPKVSTRNEAMDVIKPNHRDAQALHAMKLLLKGDASRFKDLARPYVTPKSLEPRKSAQSDLTTLLSSMELPPKEEVPAEAQAQPWVQAYLHFDGRVPLYFFDWQWSTWFWYCGRRYPICPVGIWLLAMTLLGVLADFACSRGVLILWLLGRKEWLACDAPGSNQVKAYLYTHDQGGEGVEYKTEGFVAVLRENYHGPSYITGLNKCCRGSYQRWALRELQRAFYVPQEVQLYQDFGCFHVPGESLQNITAEEMHRRLRGIQTTCSCMC